MRDHANRAISALVGIGQNGLATCIRIAETPAEALAALDLASGITRYLTISLAHLFGEDSPATMRAARAEAACAIAVERIHQNQDKESTNDRVG